MNKHENAEIVVIGGGAVGTAVACYLARDGADVALVERGEYAWGSSRRCDGHAVTYDSAPGYFSQFCKIGQDMFPEISRELPCDIEFEPEGLGLLVDDERDMETVLANYEGKKNEGVDVTFWDRDELLRHDRTSPTRSSPASTSTATPSSTPCACASASRSWPAKRVRKPSTAPPSPGSPSGTARCRAWKPAAAASPPRKWCWPPASGPPASATWWV